MTPGTRPIPMKAITLWQPWASLVMILAKPLEFRPKHFTQYIGHPPVGATCVLHAGARPVRLAEVDDLLHRLDAPGNPTGLVFDLARPMLERCLDSLNAKRQPLPLGAGLGTVKLGEPQMADRIFPMQVADSDRGRFNSAWPMLDVKPWDEPVRCRGSQGFFNWPFQLEKSP